jgi:hypothetical protein
MRRKVLTSISIVGALLCVALLTFLGIRIYDSQRGLPLEPWHTYVPHELSAEKLDASNWTQYLAAEATIFRRLRVPHFCRKDRLLASVNLLGAAGSYRGSRYACSRGFPLHDQAITRYLPLSQERIVRSSSEAI